MSEGLSAFCENPKCPSPLITGKRLKCSQCRSLYYCSAQCQKIHWKSHHKKECFDYKTMTIFDIERRKLKGCPLKTTLGPHLHPIIEFTHDQEKQNAKIVDCITRLPRHDKYRLSCRCQTMIKDTVLLKTVLIQGPGGNDDIWYVVATCPNIFCPTARAVPLLILQRPQNMKGYDVFAMVPFIFEEDAESFSVLNCNYPGDVTVFGEVLDTDCTCGLKHYEFLAMKKTEKHNEFEIIIFPPKNPKLVTNEKI